MVVIPEDREEMSPEEMLAENLPTESPAPGPDISPSPEPDAVEAPEETQMPVVPGEEQVQEILDRVVLDLDGYKELYNALDGYAESLRRYMVTVTALTSNIDWLDSVQESKNQCSGVIVNENGMELLILADYAAIGSAERLVLTFYDESQAEAQIKLRIWQCCLCRWRIYPRELRRRRLFPLYSSDIPAERTWQERLWW